MKKFYLITVMLLLTIATKAQVTWTQLYVEEFEYVFLMDISCVNENVTYVCGDVGNIQKTTDGGKTWTQLLDENVNIRFQSIKFIDEHIGFVGGGTVSGGTRTPDEKGGLLWKTTDGGLSWQDITPQDSIEIVVEIFPIDKDTLYLLQYFSNVLLKSIDAGSTWDTAFHLPSTEGIMDFHAVDSTVYVVTCGYNDIWIKIYQTKDYAKTWQEEYRSKSHNPASCDIVFFHPDTVYVYFPDSLLYTTDGFLTYENYPYYSPRSSMAKVKRFTNGNYCLITHTRPTDYYFQGLVNGSSFYNSVFSADAVDGCNDSIFYILTYIGLIYTNRYFEPDDVVVEIENDNLISVFPNPCNGQLRIENGELRIENIEIYTMAGQKLSTFNFQLSTTIDISHLPAGIYFLQLQTEKGVTIKKIIKE